MEIIIEIRGKSIFWRRTIFLLVDTNFFNFFRGFLKWKPLFIIAKTYFSISIHPASANGLSAYWKQYFLVSAISVLAKTITGIRRKQFWEKDLIIASELIFWLVEIFFSPFFRDSCQWFIFLLVEAPSSIKSVIPISGNGFSGQWKPLCFLQSFSSKWKL